MRTSLSEGYSSTPPDSISISNSIQAMPLHCNSTREGFQLRDLSLSRLLLRSALIPMNACTLSILRFISPCHPNPNARPDKWYSAEKMKTDLIFHTHRFGLPETICKFKERHLITDRARKEDGSAHLLASLRCRANVSRTLVVPTSFFNGSERESTYAMPAALLSQEGDAISSCIR